jgi:hypothetical protein
MSLNFPNSPTVGQLFPATATPGVPQWVWDGSSWVTPIGASGNFMSNIKIQRFTASGTYTPTAGMQFCVIECVGGGGGGGGCSGNNTSVNGGGGGGGGSYARRVATAVQIGASQTVTTGTGGNGGAAGANNGLAGSDTSLGTLCVGKGGSGGIGVATTGAIGKGGAGGVAGTGDFTAPGQDGGIAFYASSLGGSLYGSGGGGNSGNLWGAGGQPAFAGSGAALNGNAGTGYGGGGGGAHYDAMASANAAGGNGAPGCVLVTEYGNWSGAGVTPNPPMRGYLHGLTLSTAGSSATFSVAIGQATDSTFVDNLTLATSISKTTAAWAAGTAVGSLDTGAIANNTWYHVHLIKNPTSSAVDVLVSLSPTSPTMPSGFTLSRRLGAMRTNASGQWWKFLQTGDYFAWDIPWNELNGAAIPTTATTASAFGGVPTGQRIQAQVEGYATAAAAMTIAMWANDTTGGITAPYYSLLAQVPSASGYGGYNALLWVDANAQVKWWGSSSGGTLTLNILGYFDRRGRDA